MWNNNSTTESKEVATFHHFQIPSHKPNSFEWYIIKSVHICNWHTIFLLLSCPSAIKDHVLCDIAQFLKSLRRFSFFVWVSRSQEWVHQWLLLYLQVLLLEWLLGIYRVIHLLQSNYLASLRQEVILTNSPVNNTGRTHIILLFLLNKLFLQNAMDFRCPLRLYPALCNILSKMILFNYHLLFYFFL